MARLEICTGDPVGVMAAVEGGADRVELCSGLAEGGLTPSAATIRFASRRIPTNVLIRPRSGDFIYSEEEVGVMCDDIAFARSLGAQGIVIGALLPDGRLDSEACGRMLSFAPGADTTLHRAFDLTPDPYEALETAIRLGFRRILTSGQAPTALEGARLIRELHRRADGRILIMAGAGVTPKNAAEILDLSEADEIHASARSLRPGAMEAGGAVAMGSNDAADGSRLATDPDIVNRIRLAIR